MSIFRCYSVKLWLHDIFVRVNIIGLLKRRIAVKMVIVKGLMFLMLKAVSDIKG